MDTKARDDRPGVVHSPKLALLGCEPGAFFIYAWKSVAVVCWLDRVTGPFVRRVAEITVPLVTASPGKISFVHMVERGAGLPTPEGRAGLIELMDRHGDATACVAVVLAGVGFWASAFQGMITGMHMLSPRSFPFRLESRVETAAQWLAREHLARTGTFLDGDELVSVLTEARSKALQQAPG